MSQQDDHRRELRRAIQNFDFRALFIETLGWDHFHHELPVVVDETTYQLRGVAQKRGLAVFHLATAAWLPAALRNKIETQVARSHHEHILIFSNTARARQTWLWALREPGRPIARRAFDYHTGQPGEALAQRLDALHFTLAEEDDLTLVDVIGRVRAAFNVERATKKFYDRFRKEREAFEAFVGGIPDLDMTKWYVSVMLNRLMFVYFIQKKGFLDGDPDYLRNRLAKMRATYGPDQFDRFYRAFLLRLFHDGLGGPGRDADLERLIGRVPYLNGGIFQQHEVERRYPDIQIPDEAFARVFDFFDGYQWHLDDRPLRDDREINPDVLGYIFEKYINQKQMGAYYTKEDITEYISKNTIIPFLFDRARRACAVAFGDKGAFEDKGAFGDKGAFEDKGAFRGEGSVWAIAAADPDRYIYPAARKGADLPLPDEIAAGIDDAAARDGWNAPAPEAFALPTEIWRETIARRQRYEATRARLAAGDVGDINDFITLNLDIRQFAQDVVERAEGPDLLAAFWDGLTGVSALDPTCGSGAFLFAALNVLEPLYEAAIGRMREFLGEPAWRALHPRYTEKFGAVLADIDRHPNETYFIQKSIIVNNLYGVDIMAEAVEIAKLRLFLKLAAQIERVEDVEPLPDIDFNIRAGNTLVGYVKREEVRDALTVTRDAKGGEQRNLLFAETHDALAAVEEKAADIDRLYAQFRAMQTGEQPPDDLPQTKAEMRRRLAALNDELDRALARQYGVDPNDAAAFAKWRAGHQPFHWFTEFYGILQGGGFDVVIGNPPYVEYTSVRKEYSVRNYATIECGNLYAYVMERSKTLLKPGARTSMIVPLSGHSTDRMKPLIDKFYLPAQTLHLINLSADAHPSILFPGVRFRLAIFVYQTPQATRISTPGTVFTTKYIRWYSGARGALFETIEFTKVQSLLNESLPKMASDSHTKVLSILEQQLALGLANHTGPNTTYYHNAPVHWIRAHAFIPYFTSERDGEKISTQLKPLAFESEEQALAAAAILCSSTFFIWWLTTSDCYHLNNREVFSFPFDLTNRALIEDIAEIGRRLMKDMLAKSRRRVYHYRTSGRVEYDEFYMKQSKEIIDEVDAVLAQHYGFTAEELDFIINYDIKYRMGDELFAGESDE